MFYEELQKQRGKGDRQANHSCNSFKQGDKKAL